MQELSATQFSPEYVGTAHCLKAAGKTTAKEPMIIYVKYGEQWNGTDFATAQIFLPDSARAVSEVKAFCASSAMPMNLQSKVLFFPVRQERTEA